MPKSLALGCLPINNKMGTSRCFPLRLSSGTNCLAQPLAGHWGGHRGRNYGHLRGHTAHSCRAGHQTVLSPKPGPRPGSQGTTVTSHLKQKFPRKTQKGPRYIGGLMSFSAHCITLKGAFKKVSDPRGQEADYRSQRLRERRGRLFRGDEMSRNWAEWQPCTVSAKCCWTAHFKVLILCSVNFV